MGARCYISAEAVTPISTIGQYVPIQGTKVASNMQHFDSPGDGQLRNLGNNPREFEGICRLRSRCST